MFRPLDGPSLQSQQTVTDDTVFRVKVGAEEFKERDVVTIQALNGNIWVYFGDNSTTPTVAQVKDAGFLQLRSALATWEASDKQEIYIVADVGTVDVRYAERG